MINTKPLLLLTVLCLSASLLQALSHEQSMTDQIPQDNFGQYQIQSCCPTGYNVAG